MPFSQTGQKMSGGNSQHADPMSNSLLPAAKVGALSGSSLIPSSSWETIPQKPCANMNQLILEFRSCWVDLWRDCGSHQISQSIDSFPIMRHSLVRMRFNLLVYVLYAPLRLIARSLIRGTGGRDAKQHHQTSLQGSSLAAGPSIC